MGESGAEGAELEARLRSAAAGAGMRLLGPNTSGLLAPGAGLFATFVVSARAIPPGGLGIVSQSGGVNHALGFAAANAGLGVSFAVGLGNGADLGPAELVRWLGKDPSTRLIVLALEGIAEGRALFDAIAAVVPEKPVVALKAGKTDVDAFAQSHTGALLGSWQLATSALRQAGAVVVESSVELIDAARALAARRAEPAPRPGAAVVSGQAGPALLLADALGSRGVTLPTLGEETQGRLGELLDGGYLANPVDTGRPGPGFGAAVEATRADPRIGATAVYVLQEPEAVDPAAALGAGAERPPTVFVTAGPAAEVARTAEGLGPGVPTYDAPERAATAIYALLEDARGRHRLGRGGAQAPPPPGAAGAAALDEAALKEALARRGLPAPRGIVVEGRAEALAALATLGPPVVVKALDPGIAHKSEVGAVHVGVGDAAALDRALAAIERASRVRRYLIEEQAGPGVELLIGARVEPGWGPVCALALGGVAAEAIERVALRLAPFGADEALELIAELDADRLLDGFRGLPPVDRGQLAAAMLAVVDLLLADPRLAEVEVNPVRATAGGLLALDAWAALAAPAQSG
jgi:acetyltransferase